MSSKQTVTPLHDATFQRDEIDENFDASASGEDWRIPATLKQIQATQEQLSQDPDSRTLKWHLASLENYLAKLQRQIAS